MILQPLNLLKNNPINNIFKKICKRWLIIRNVVLCLRELIIYIITFKHNMMFICYQDTPYLSHTSKRQNLLSFRTTSDLRSSKPREYLVNFFLLWSFFDMRLRTTGLTIFILRYITRSIRNYIIKAFFKQIEFYSYVHTCSL